MKFLQGKTGDIYQGNTKVFQSAPVTFKVDVGEKIMPSYRLYFNATVRGKNIRHGMVYLILF